MSLRANLRVSAATFTGKNREVTLKLATGIKVTLAINCLLLAFFFGEAYRIGGRIDEINERARLFAQKHDLFPKERIEFQLGAPSSFDRFQRHGELFTEYMGLLAQARALYSQRFYYISFGQMCFLGFPILGVFTLILTQRERDNLKLPEDSFNQLYDSVYEIQSRKGKDKERIAISASDRSIYFDGFALIKGFSLIPRKKAFRIPFSSVIDCFHQPVKGEGATLILVTKEGKIVIENTMSDCEKLFLNFKSMATQTPDAGLIHKPWFQGLLTIILVPAGVALICGIYFYFFD